MFAAASIGAIRDRIANVEWMVKLPLDDTHDEVTRVRRFWRLKVNPERAPEEGKAVFDAVTQKDSRMKAVNSNPIRATAANMAALLVKYPLDPTKDPEELARALSPLVGAHEALFEVARERPTVLKRSRIAYFDPGLTILVSAFGPEFREPIHDHGLWNVLLICQGRMHFRGYRRLDDQSNEGYAEISKVEDRIVGVGQIGAVGPPPHDIHALDVLDEDTWMITVSPGDAKNVRNIYDPATNSYTLQTLADANTKHTAALA